MTTLCFDFGNTRKKCAVFNNDLLAEILVMENDSDSTIQNLIDQYHPGKTILSSVIHHNPAMETILSNASLFHKLNSRSVLSFTIPVGKPETVGADRLALCSAATHFYPRQNNLIIALGSCITYNFINQTHEFLGGSISPGLQIRFKSLNDYTAFLPVVEPEPVFPLIGYDTKTNILSGVIIGMAKEIDGIVAAYEEKFSNFNAILTGGDTSYFVPLLKNKIFADINFLYKGLYAISQRNNQ
jgi:type III pantothenate kinase